MGGAANSRAPCLGLQAPLGTDPQILGRLQRLPTIAAATRMPEAEMRHPACFVQERAFGDESVRRTYWKDLAPAKFQLGKHPGRYLFKADLALVRTPFMGLDASAQDRFAKQPSTPILAIGTQNRLRCARQDMLASLYSRVSIVSPIMVPCDY